MWQNDRFSDCASWAVQWSRVVVVVEKECPSQTTAPWVWRFEEHAELASCVAFTLSQRTCCDLVKNSGSTRHERPYFLFSCTHPQSFTKTESYLFQSYISMHNKVTCGVTKNHCRCVLTRCWTPMRPLCSRKKSQEAVHSFFINWFQCSTFLAKYVGFT